MGGDSSAFANIIKRFNEAAGIIDKSDDVIDTIEGMSDEQDIQTIIDNLLPALREAVSEVAKGRAIATHMYEKD